MKRPNQTGKVYLVGAGPGHPELLTIKAAELIKTGDVIVYDRLIQEEVLALAKPTAERIYMGKPLAKHESRQDEIHELMERLAREGKTVVRLKGGDPFLFGRGGEEAEYLADHDIPFEVIPGVCSALSAPLSAGIAVTHRDTASAVAIVTGHNADGTEGRIDWTALAHVDTLVFLMAVHNTPKIAANLISAGRSPQTPAAIVQMAFWHDERVVSGTLENIGQLVQESGIKPPATLVVGEVVRLREKLQCSERDLRRRPDGSARFQPSPSPDQLLRIAAGGVGTQVLGWALETGLFDELENPATTFDLAHRLGLNADAMNDILRALVSLGLLESRPDGYRNLELASRYLRSDSPLSLRELLLYNSSQLVQWTALADFAKNGRTSAEAGRDGELYIAACETAARFVVPGVIDKLEHEPTRGVLVVGWGGEAHRSAIVRRWPNCTVTTWNPFRGESFPDAQYGLVLLAGVLQCCDPAGLDRILASALSRIDPEGRVVLHDTVVSVGVLPPPELALASLARHIVNRDYHMWSIERVTAMLERYGVAVSKSELVSCGYAVISGGSTKTTALAATA